MTGEVIFWLVAFVLLVIAEFATLQLTSIWFAAGSFVALILAAFKLPLWLQIIAFILIATVMLVVTRPILRRMFNKNYVPTNAELDVGSTAVVIEVIDNEKLCGRVTLNGVDWSALSSDNAVIGKGVTVRVEKVDGSKLIVSAIG